MNAKLIKSFFFILFAWSCLASAEDSCDGFLKKYSGSSLECYDGSVSNPINTFYSESELRVKGQSYCQNRCSPKYASKCGLKNVLRGGFSTYFKQEQREVSFTCYDNSEVKTSSECAKRCSSSHSTKCGVKNSKTELVEYKVILEPVKPQDSDKVHHEEAVR